MTQLETAPPQTAPRTIGGRSRHDMVRILANGGGQLTVLVAIVLYFGLASDSYLSVLNVQTIALDSSVLLLVASGECLVILLGSIDLSVSGVIALVALSVAHYSNQGWGEGALIVLALVLGAAAGLVNGLIHVVGKIPSFLGTLGTSFIFPGIVQLLFGAVPITLVSTGLVAHVQTQVLGIPTPAIIAVICLIVVVIAMRKTVFGRSVYAVGGNEVVAAFTGLKVSSTKILVFTLAGLLYGIAALLLSVRIGSATADMGDDLLLPGIAAVVIGGTPLSGGVGGVGRTIFGVLLLGALINGMNVMSVSPFVQLIVEGAVVIAAVMFAVRQRRTGIVK